MNNYHSLSKYRLLKRLVESGLSQKQSIAIYKLASYLEDQKSKIFATKEDIKEILQKFDQMSHEIEKLEMRMLIKLGSLIAVTISLVISFAKVI